MDEALIAQSWTYYWSNSNKGFYVDQIHGDKKPGDCVALTYEEYRNYLDKQSIGFEIVPSQGTGKPTLVDRRPTPTEVEATNVRVKRGQLLAKYVDAVNQVRWSLLTPEQQAYLTNYRQLLLDITDTPGFPYDVIWPTEPDFKV
jgi:hypothetical protein